MSIGALSDERAFGAIAVADEADAIPADVRRWRDSENAVSPAPELQKHPVRTEMLCAAATMST